MIPDTDASLRSDLDKDVRLQVVDSLQRIYIPVDNTGPIRTIFNQASEAYSLQRTDPSSTILPRSSPAVNQALADAMQKDFSQEVRAAAARALGSLRARDRLGVLISTLESPQNREHMDVRVEIVESLGLLQDPAQVPPLSAPCETPTAEISQAAILSIGQVGHRAAREALESIFRTDRSDISRGKALQSIALMRDPGAQPLFESQLSSPNDYYREMAAEGLARVNADVDVLKARYGMEKKTNVSNALAFALVAADQDNYFDDSGQCPRWQQGYSGPEIPV